MLSTIKISVKILAFWSLFLLSSIFFNLWRLEFPNITGDFALWGAMPRQTTGPFAPNTFSVNQNGTVGGGTGVNMDLSRANSFYKNSSTVQPASCQALMIIKL